MDKLEPVLEQKFWIITAVVLILPSYGWWKATTAIQEDTDDRIRTVNAAFQSLPPDAEVPAIPNEEWTRQVAERNTERNQQNQHSAAYLWESQQALMVWPDDVAEAIKAAGYRGQLKNTVSRTYYAEGYERQIAKLRQIVKPFNPGTGRGMVRLDDGSLTRVPPDRWGPDKLPPTVSEIWNAQEDIWLQSALYSAIAEVNRNATSIIDAPIKIINRVLLLGGNRQSANQGPAARAESTTRTTSARRDPSGLSTNPARANARSGFFTASVDFPPENEFGVPVQGAAFEGGRVRRQGGRRSGDDDEEDEEDEADSGPAVVRYIDDGPNSPYRTRGFYMKLVMDERHIPELLVELTSLEWPVEIVRVHRVSLSESDLGSTLRTRVSRLSGQQVSDRAQNVMATALNEPYLSTVVVAGLMTLYNPVKPPAKGAAETADQDAPATTENQESTEAAANDSDEPPSEETGAAGEPAAETDSAEPDVDLTPADETPADEAPAPDAETGAEDPAADDSTGTDTSDTPNGSAP